jgi:LmbE family N-acetylglucosaminyl deacetylase
MKRRAEMKALSVVAHSDDHILWMGGTILRFNQWTWHILSLCKSHNDESFEPKRGVFERSCAELGASRYSAKDFKDYQPREAMESEQLKRMKEEILAFAGNSYDFVFTHSIQENCEYGFHANHTEVRDAVSELISDGLLTTKAALHFCYRSGGYKKAVIADLSKADYKVELYPEEISRKRNLKHIFTWARGDLEALTLWGNDEPTVEAFQARALDLQLPPDFIRVS